MTLTWKKAKTIGRFALIAMLIGSTLVLTLTGTIAIFVLAGKMIALHFGPEAAALFSVCIAVSFIVFAGLLVSNPIE